MKTINVSEATGSALNWLVARALGAQWVKTPESQSWLMHWPSPLFGEQPLWSVAVPKYSTDWSQGGPIIENAGISVVQEGDAACWVASEYDHKAQDWHMHTTGPTPLVAAMRCHVISKLGLTAEVPEELA